MEEGRKSSLSFRLAALPKPLVPGRLRIDWDNRRALVRVSRRLKADPGSELPSPNEAGGRRGRAASVPMSNAAVM
jgi:hypothetical protein